MSGGEEVSATVEIGDIVLTKVPARVIVEQAPEHSTISLELLRRSDPDLLFIAGDRLFIGNTSDGEEVSYKVTGWQPSPPGLTLTRIRDVPQ